MGSFISDHNKHLLFASSLFVAVWLVLESVCHLTGFYLQSRWAMYQVPKVHDKTIAFGEYLERREPILGWPYPDQLDSFRYQKDGSRPCPACRELTGSNCLELYGDSFTQSPQADTQTWGNLLAQTLGCKVGNYGVGGYGTDQAFLRYRERPQSPAETVILAHYSENIIRNLTRNRDFLTSSRWYALKPRFILDEYGQLKLLPIPFLTEDEYQDWLQGSKNVHLDHENFAPGGPEGATLLRFPYSRAVLKNLADFRMRARMHRQPEYAAFYQPQHPAQGLEITAQIMEAFTQNALDRQQKPVLLLLPSLADLQNYRRQGWWYYQNLKNRLEKSHLAKKVQILDFGPVLAQYLEGRALAPAFDETLHYQPEIDALLADFISLHLQPLPRPYMAKQKQQEQRSIAIQEGSMNTPQAF